MKKSTLLLLLILSSTLFGNNQLLPKESSVIEGQLDNGFKYSIMHNPKPKKRAEFRLLVKVGSLEEQEDERGLAHFIEHMAFNGSKHFKKNELVDYLESIGVQYGGDLNANTGFERTVYKLTVPLEKDNVEKSFQIFSDWAGGLTFDKKEFDKERGVILEEERLRNGVGLRVYHQYNQLLYGNSSYIKREPIGTREVVKNVSVEKAKAFYKKWYRPELMHFIVVGDFNTTKMEEKIKETFSSLSNVNHVATAPRKVLENNTTRMKVVWDKELTTNSMELYYLDELEETRTKSDLRRGIVDGMMIRLFNDKAKEQIEKENPKASIINFNSSGINKNRGFYKFITTSKEKDELAALTELYTLMFSFEKYGFAQNALNRLKEQMLSSNEKSYRRIHDQTSSSLVSSLLFYAQSDSIFVDYDEEYKLTKSLIKDIKLSEINALYRKILNYNDKIILFTKSKDANITMENIEQIVKEAEGKVEDVSQEKALPKTLAIPDLNSSKILSRSYNKELDIHTFTLENGIEVSFKQTDFTKDNIQLQAFSFGGESLYDADKLLELERSTLFVESSGVGAYSSLELSKILSNKSISLSTSIYPRSDSIDGAANSKDIESLFALLYLRLSEAKVDKKVGKNIKNILKTRADEVLNSPQVRFRREAQKYYYLDDPRIQFENRKNIEAFDESRMLANYKDRFSDMNNFKFIIVGDVSLEKIEALCQKYLGNLPTKMRKENFVKREETYRKGAVRFERNNNSENITHLSVEYKSKVPYTLKEGLIANALGEILTIRLRHLIREDKSGVYGIGADVSLDRLETNSEGTIHFSCDPKREKELLSMVYKKIEEIKEKPVSKEEMDVSKKAFLTYYETAQRKNYFWISMIEKDYKKIYPLTSINKMEGLVKSITAQDILTLANKIFSKDRLELILRPKEKATK